MSTKPVIGFAGMTHLGLNSAVAAASKGFNVVGFDADEGLISELSSGKTQINEPDLSEMLTDNSEKLEFSTSTDSLSKCDIVYLSIDVPTDDKAESDLTPIREMIEVVNGVMNPDSLLVILCQVPPGFTRSIERKPSKLYYQVETLIFGRAIERALYPERYIIGCSDPENIDPRFTELLESCDCPILPMRYESAELAKTAINLFLAASVCTANSLAETCEKIGADWQEIIPALRLDRRIGEHAYIQPGLGLSGGNIERDLKTVSGIGYENGAKINVPTAYIDHSKYRKKWPIRQFYENYDNSKNFKVGVLGLSYKENTHSIKNSPAIELIDALPDIKINVYDPVVKEIPKSQKVTFCQSADDVSKDVDLLFVMTPWDEFKNLEWKHVIAAMNGNVIIDPYRLVSSSDDCKHIVLGRS